MRTLPIYPPAGAGFLVGWLLGGGWVLSASAQEARMDTTSGYLDRLQEADREGYSPDLLRVDPAARDSALAVLDSLGYEGYRTLVRSRIRPWDLDLVPASKLLAYDRVQGLVLGLGLHVSSNRREGLELTLEGAWATAAGAFRNFAELDVPGGPVTFTAGYADRAVPYGSNRITLNGVRALVGGSDDQDYLDHRGAWGGIRSQPTGWLRLRAIYDAARLRSLRTRGVWSLFGDLEEPNPGIQEGTQRSVLLGLEAGSLHEGRERLDIDYEVAGGGLGGDLTFHRIAVTAQGRRYVLPGTEATLDLGWVETGGEVPVQELADIGGLSTVRGFARRSRVGEESLRGRLETYLPLDPLALTHIPVLEKGRVQIVLWSDAARVFTGDSDAWLSSLGVGLERYLGPFGPAAKLRLDFAFPTGPERPDDMAVFLRFTPALF